MFAFLKVINKGLYERYLTLERNIKAGSNSFYDAYLDLQEHFVKEILKGQGVEIKAWETCGALLRRNEVKHYLVEVLQVGEYTYGKLQDYTKKANEHKHRSEKIISLETVLKYLRVFYDVSTAYAKYSDVSFMDFDQEYFVFIFGIYEKENQELRQELQLLVAELSEIMQDGKAKEGNAIAYQELLSQLSLDKMSLEEQNAQLLKQISKLKDIKLTSMEEKLNRAIDMLLSLQQMVVDNRALSYAIGDTICGRERFAQYLDRAREELNNG